MNYKDIPERNIKKIQNIMNYTDTVNLTSQIHPVLNVQEYSSEYSWGRGVYGGQGEEQQGGAHDGQEKQWR